MIFGSDQKFNPPELIMPKNLRDANGLPVVPQPMMVLRFATRQEYDDDLRADGGDPATASPVRYYYEVSTD